MKTKFTPPRKFISSKYVKALKKPKLDVVVISDDEVETPIVEKKIDWCSQESFVLGEAEDEHSQHSSDFEEEDYPEDTDYARETRKEMAHDMMALNTEIVNLEQDNIDLINVNQTLKELVEKLQNDNKSLDLQIVILKQTVDKLERSLKNLHIFKSE